MSIEREITYLQLHSREVLDAFRDDPALLELAKKRLEAFCLYMEEHKEAKSVTEPALEFISKSQDAMQPRTAPVYFADFVLVSILCERFYSIDIPKELNAVLRRPRVEHLKLVYADALSYRNLLESEYGGEIFLSFHFGMSAEEMNGLSVSRTSSGKLILSGDSLVEDRGMDFIHTVHETLENNLESLEKLLNAPTSRKPVRQLTEGFHDEAIRRNASFRNFKRAARCAMLLMIVSGLPATFIEERMHVTYPVIARAITTSLQVPSRIPNGHEQQIFRRPAFRKDSGYYQTGKEN